MDFGGRRILITGGTGFIGGRLVEILAGRGAAVRVLVRNIAGASRIARFPVELTPGDVTQPAAVQPAAQGCDVIFHCAYGKEGDAAAQRAVNVDGTRHVLEAAKQAGARVVHVSTLSVYGDTPDGVLDESAPRRYSQNPYADTKLDGEKLALEFGRTHGVPVAVVQPTIVYGPFAPAWTVRLLNDLQTRRVILINGGDGLCNAVYIDDLIHGMLLAAVKPEAAGEAFLLSGAQPVMWREFYAAYEAMLGVSATVSMSRAQADAHYRAAARRKSLPREMLAILRQDRNLRWRIEATREGNALLELSRRLAPKGVRQGVKQRLGIQDAPPAASPLFEEPAPPPRPILPSHPSASRFMAAKTAVSIAKARRLLGYEPGYDLARGMRLTEEWARWANLGAQAE
jgi:nucleoside-diphosphate-sugar epimerase